MSNPDIMRSKPTIEGTRITVELILEELGEGLAVADLLGARPHPSGRRSCRLCGSLRTTCANDGHFVRKSRSGSTTLGSGA